MQDSESCISLASWVLERDQMGIIIIWCLRRELDTRIPVQVLSLGRETPESSRRKRGNELEKIRQLIKMLSNKLLG